MDHFPKYRDHLAVREPSNVKWHFLLLLGIVCFFLLAGKACADECMQASIACGEGLPGCGEAIRRCANQGVTRPYYWPIIKPVSPIVVIDPTDPIDLESSEAVCNPANEDCEFAERDEP